MTIISIAGNILKKYTMVNFPKITLSNIKDPKIWIQLMTNPLALLTLFIGYVFWGLSMIVVQFENISTVTMVTTGLTPVILLATIYLSTIIFNESLTPKQNFGLVLLIISLLFGIASVYYTGGD